MLLPTFHCPHVSYIVLLSTFQCLHVSYLTFFHVSVLACVIYYIATHSDVDKKLYEEIKTVLGDRKVDEINMKDLM